MPHPELVDLPTFNDKLKNYITRTGLSTLHEVKIRDGEMPWPIVGNQEICNVAHGVGHSSDIVLHDWFLDHMTDFVQYARVIAEIDRTVYDAFGLAVDWRRMRGSRKSKILELQMYMQHAKRRYALKGM